MVLCPKCKNFVEDDEIYCGVCGEQIIREKSPAEMEMPFSYVANDCEAVINGEPACENISAKKSKKFKIIVTLCVAWILIIAILLSGLFFRKSQDPYGLYIKDSQLYYVDLTNGKSLRLTNKLYNYQTTAEDGYYDSDYSYMAESLGRYINLSDDGKIVFYYDNIIALQGGAKLCYRYINNHEDDPKVIDTLVVTYQISKSGDAVAYISANDEIALYYSDLKKKEKIHTSVMEYKLSGDGKRLIFLDTEGNIYFKDKGKKKQKLDTSATRISFVNDEYDTVYYLKQEDLYKVNIGQKPQKIDAEIDTLINFYDSGEVYYLKLNSNSIKLSNYVIDDMKEHDANIKEPEYLEYPAYWDYETEEDYEKALEEYEAKYEKQEATEEAWSEKKNRDLIREDLANATIDSYYYKLCYYDGKKTKVLTENFTFYDEFAFAAEKPAIIYKGYDFLQVDKLKLSEYNSIYEISDKVQTQMQENLSTTVAVKDKCTVVAANEFKKYFITDDGKTVYLLDRDDTAGIYGNIFKMDISGNKPQKIDFYDRGVLCDYVYLVGGNKIIYYKDVYDASGDLYFEGEKVDSDVLVNRTKYIEEDKALVYFTDWITEDGTGSLKHFKNGKSKQLGKEVTQFQIGLAGEILYLQGDANDENAETMFAYINGRTKKISDDVMSIIPANTISDIYELSSPWYVEPRN